MAYRLDLAACKRQALRGLHDVFHIGLLRRYQSNGLAYKVPPIGIDGKEQYEVQAFWKHRVIHGEAQYLVKWVGYNESKNLWLTTSQMNLAKEILETYQ